MTAGVSKGNIQLQSPPPQEKSPLRDLSQSRGPLVKSLRSWIICMFFLKAKSFLQLSLWCLTKNNRSHVGWHWFLLVLQSENLQPTFFEVPLLPNCRWNFLIPLETTPTSPILVASSVRYFVLTSRWGPLNQKNLLTIECSIPGFSRMELSWAYCMVIDKRGRNTCVICSLFYCPF